LTVNIWVIVDGQKKQRYSHCRKETHINQTIAVGRWCNDFTMLNLAVWVAFHAKATVKRKCFLVDSSLGLDGVCTF
jgi:phosphoserine phosphatase